MKLTIKGGNHMSNKSIGEIISSLRKEKGMTQNELAQKMNVTDKAVSKWERNLSCPDVNSIPRLAEMLGTTVDELLNAPTKQENKKLYAEDLKSIYYGCAILFGAIGFIWAYTANRFHVYEYFFIAFLFAIAGFGFGSIIHAIIKLIKEK